MARENSLIFLKYIIWLFTKFFFAEKVTENIIFFSFLVVTLSWSIAQSDFPKAQTPTAVLGEKDFFIMRLN